MTTMMILAVSKRTPKNLMNVPRIPIIAMAAIAILFTPSRSARPDGSVVAHADSPVREIDNLEAAILDEMESDENREAGIPMMCQGRLTLLSNDPIPTADQGDTNTIYFTPYQGNRIALWNVTSSKWQFHTFTQRSLTLAGLTTGRPYDVFIYNNAGTLTLEATTWTSTTARVAADDLIKQNGVYVRTGEPDRRYLGTFIATSATTTRDTSVYRYLWNYYHRQPRYLRVTETVNNYVYNSTTRRQVNANAANQVNYVVGVDEVIIFTNSLHIAGGQTANHATNLTSCVGIDATNVCIAVSPRGGFTSNMIRNPLWSESNQHHGIGYHYLAWIEASFNDTGANDPVFYGDDASDGRLQAGMMAIIEG